MKQKMSRALAILLSVLMLIGSMPVNALAQSVVDVGNAGQMFSNMRASKGSYTIDAGATQSLTGTSSDRGHSWESSNTSVATVTNNNSQSATVTGVSAGTATITHKYGWNLRYSETWTITVESRELELSTQTVYIYVQLTGEWQGLVDTNRNTNWVTVGKMEMQLPDPEEAMGNMAYGSYAIGAAYLQDAVRHLKSNGYTAYQPHAHVLTEDIILNRVTWTESGVGLNVSNGADHYNDEAGSYAWHLDGKLDVENKYFIDHYTQVADDYSGEYVTHDGKKYVLHSTEHELYWGNQNTTVYADDYIESIPGYTYVGADPEQINLRTSDQRLQLFYDLRDDITYTVNYYEEGTTTKVADSKIVDGQTMGASVTEEAIDVSGYIKLEPTEKTITLEISGNVINFYYRPVPTASYTVEYYLQNADGSYSSDGDPATRSDAVGAHVAVTDADKAKYNNDTHHYEAANRYNVLSGTVAEDGSLVLKVYFARNEADYVIHHYLEGTTTKVAADEKGSMAIGSTLTARKSNALYSEYSEAYVSRFVSSNGSSSSITISVGTNEIIVYYMVPLAITAGSEGWTYDGEAHRYGEFSMEGLVNGDRESDFTVTMDSASVITNVGSVANIISSVSYKNGSIPSYYNVSKYPGTLTVSKKAITVTIIGEKVTATYDGSLKEAEGYSVSISDPLYTEADFSFSGNAYVSGVNAKTYPMGLAVNQFTNNDANFTVTFKVEDGKLVIKPIETPVIVTITGQQLTTTYDGSPKKAEGYSVSISNDLYTEADFRFSGTALVSKTDARDAKYPMGLAESQFTNINTTNFTNVKFVVNDGWLKIDRRAIEITADYAEKEFDGTPLTKNTYAITNGSFAPNEGFASVTVEGSQLFPGSSANTITGHTLKANTKETNYTINYVSNTLLVKDRTTPYAVTAIAPKGIYVYDGTEKSASGVTFQQNADAAKPNTVAINGVEYTIEGLASEYKSTNVINQITAISGKAVVKLNGVDVTKQFAVNTGDTNLFIIQPRPVVITINSDTADYNGNAHTVAATAQDGSEYLFTVTQDNHSADNLLGAGLLATDSVNLAVAYDGSANAIDAGSYIADVAIENGVQQLTITQTGAAGTPGVDVTANYSVTINPGTLVIYPLYVVDYYKGDVYWATTIEFKTNGADRIVLDEGTAAGQLNYHKTAGWSDGKQETFDIDPNVNINHLIVRYSHDTESIANVTYVAETGGSVNHALDEIHVVTGATVNGSTATPAAGYEFVGWYKGEALISAEAELTAAIAEANLNTIAVEDETLYDDTQYVAKFQKASFTYTVHYFYDKVEDAQLRETESAIFESVITSADVELKPKAGYELKEINPESLTIGADAAANVINVYYEKADFGYAIHYFINGEQDANLTEIGVASYGDVITSYPDKAPAGYKLEKAENLPLTITEEASANVIKVYYVKESYAYTVKFYTDAVEAANYIEGADQNGTALYGTSLAGLNINPTIEEAYRPANYNGTGTIDGSSLSSITADAAANVVNVVLKPITGVSYVVNYIWNNEGTIINSKTEGDQTAGTEVTESPIAIPGYTAVSSASETIELSGEADAAVVNVINFYYYKNAVLTANSEEEAYTGAEQKVSGYEVEAELDGEDLSEAANFEITVGAAGTDVGEYPAEFADDVVGKLDTTGKYIVVEAIDGLLVITPIDAVITIYTVSHEYKEDKFHTVAINGSEYEASGLLTGDTALLDVVYGSDKAQSKTFVGVYAADATRDEDGEAIVTIEDAEGRDVTANYTIAVVAGVLTITGDPVDDVKTVPNVKSEYALGDKINFTITVTNTTSETLTGVTVTDETATIVAGEGYSVEGQIATIASLVSGASVVVNAEYTVTAADILAGTHKNTATVTVGDKTFNPSAEITTEALDTALSVTKVSDVQEGDLPSVGDVITYTITIKNEGNVPYANVNVVDELVGLNTTIAELAVGEEKTYTQTYTVTETDVIAGKVLNKVVAEADPIPDPNGGTDKIPAGEDEVEDATEALETTLSVEKTTTSAPANGESYALGEAISYSIVVTNTGNVTYSNVKVIDELLGLNETIESLAPGAHETFTGSHVVAEADIIAGSVLNVATAAADPVKPGDPTTEPEGGDQTDDPTDPIEAQYRKEKITLGVKNGASYAKKNPYEVGDEIWYQITVTNTGNVTYTGLIVTDDLTGDEWTITSLKPGASWIQKTSYVVRESDLLAGGVANYAAVGGGETPTPGPSTTPHATPVPTPTPNPNPTPDTIDAVVEIDATLTVTKTSDVKTILPDVGDTIIYTITVTNDGNVAFTNVIVDDQLAGATIAEGNGYSINEAGNAVIAELAVDASVILKATYVVTEADVLSGEVKNTVTAAGDPIPDPNGGEDKVPAGEAEKTDDTAEIDASLTLEKITTSTPANGEAYALGETIRYQITVANEGNVAYTNIIVDDELEGAEIADGDGYSVNEAGNAEIAELAAGASVTITASYVVTEADILAGKVSNSATAKGDDIPDPNNPEEPKKPEDKDEVEDPTEPLDATLTVVKTTTSTPANEEGYAVGEAIEYSIVVTNEGNVAYSNIIVDDELEGAEVADGEGYSVNETGNAEIAELAVGASVTITASYVVTEADILAGKVINSVTAEGDEIPDPADPENPKKPEDKDEVEDPTEPLDATLTVVKTTTSTPANGEGYAVGETIEYSIVVANEGNVAYANVKVEDSLTGDSWTIESLAAGASQSFEVSYTVTEVDVLAGHVLNVATAAADQVDPSDPETKPEGGDEEDNPTEELDTTLTVAKTTTSTPANGETYALGETIEYSIVVTNEGNVAFTNVHVIDELVGLNETIAILPVGASETFDVSYVVKETDIVAGSVLNEATAIADPIPDPQNPGEEQTPYGEDSAEDPTDEVDPSLAVEKTTTSAPANEAGYAVGETIEYSIVVTNEGNVTFTNVEVNDPLTGLNTTIESLPVGESATFTTEYTVIEADVIAGSVKNVVTAQADPINDKKPLGGDEVTDETEPLDTTLTVVKTATSAPANEAGYAVGEAIEYSIVVTNEGNVAYANVKVEDSLTGDNWIIENLAAGASESFEVSYTVTEADVIAGHVLNVATAAADLVDPTDPETKPEGEDEEDKPTEELDTTLTVVKTTTSTPANEEGYAAGETIEYSIVVTNEGNVAYANVKVEDSLTGDSWIVESLAAGASQSFEVSYTVTEADVIAGHVLNVATAAADQVDPSDPETKPEGEDEEDNSTEELDTTLTVAKTTTSTPANGEAYVLGEAIGYSITVTNAGNVAYTNVEVEDSLTGDSWIIPTLAAGASQSFDVEYTITVADVAAGHVLNVATAAADQVDPSDPETKPEGEDEEDNPTEELDTTLTVAKTTTSTPANGEAYVTGEAIHYSITVINEGNVPYANVEVEDSLTGDSWIIPNLAIGASQTFTVEYIVTAEDAAAGHVLNVATAAADPIDPTDPETIPQNEDGEDNPTEELDTTLTVEKTTTSTPANGAAYALGETIAYSITATNAGNVEYANVEVVDSLTGDSWIIPTLAIGASQTFEVSYTVTEEDVIAGHVLNVATAAADPIDPSDPETIPQGLDEEDNPTVEAEGSFSVEKTLTNLPPRGFFMAGETATFAISVSNTGNLTLTNIAVGEQLAGAMILEGAGYIVSDNTALIAQLLPGETLVIHASYIVTEADMGQQLFNIVTATGNGPDDAHEPAPQSDDAEIPTNGLIDVSGVKLWVDEANEFNTRPAAITIELLANGEVIATTTVTGEGDAWAYSFGMLPQFDAEGNEIVYTVREVAAVGYDVEYAAESFDLTNSLQTMTLTIRYWYEEVGGEQAAPTYTRTVYYGEAYNVASPVIPGYTANPTRVTGVITGSVVHDVIYTANEDLTLTIYYVYQNGETAAPTYRKGMEPGEEFSVESPKIPGYTPSMGVVEGEIENRSLVYTVIYVPNGTTVIIEEYGVPLGVGNVEMNVGDCFE